MGTGPEAPSRRRSGTPKLLWRLYVGSIVLAIVPIIFAAAIAIHRGYVPVGDNAFFAIRARDVFSHRIPLLGEATSVSQTAKLPFNNLGPLLFDVFAVPVAVFGSNAGLMVGMALLNSASVVGVAIVAYRRGGAPLGVAAMAVTTALCWSMGSQVLIDPTQPSSLLLPFLLLVMLIWSVTCGDLPALPWAVGVASLILMSYVTYGYLVALLAIWGIVGLVLWLRSDQRSGEPPDERLDDRSDQRAGGGSWPAMLRRARRSLVVSGLVLVVCWVQPLIEQITREGNAIRLLRSLNDPGLQPIGYRVGVRLVATVLALPPWFVRPSFGRFLAGNDPGAPNPQHSPMGPQTSPSLALALCSLAALVAVLVWCGWTARRRGDRENGRAIATAGVLVVAALVTAGRMPLGVFSFVTDHTFRWLWPLSAFVFFAIAMTVAPFLRGRVRPVPLAVGLVVATAVMGALNLPSSNQGALEDNSAIPAVRDLGRQLGAMRGKGPILIVPPTRFHEPYSEGVWVQMQRAGIPFVTDDPYELRHLGPERKFTGTQARFKVVLVEGSTPPAMPGARRIALHEGMSREDAAELRALTGALERRLTRRGLHLGSSGARAALDPRWRSRLDRYLALAKERDATTIALYLAPIRPS